MPATAPSARPAAMPRSAIWSASRRWCSPSTRWMPVDWSEARYREIEQDFRAMAGSFNFAQVTIIPVAALTGDNVVHRSARMPWYAGPTLLELSGVGRSRGRAGAMRRSACRCSSCCAPRAISAAMPGPSPRGAIRLGEQDRRCAERPRRHAQAHLHHGRRPYLGGQGRCRHAGARHRSRHLARRGALGGAAASRSMPT